MKKISLIIICFLIIVLGLFFSQKTNKEIEEDVLKISDYCSIEVNGYNGEGQAQLACHDIPTLLDKKEKYLKNFDDNLEEYVKLSETEQLNAYQEKISVLNLNKDNICEIQNNSNLKNGEQIELICQDTLLKTLEFTFKNDISYTIENLEEKEVVRLDDDLEYSEIIDYPKVDIDPETEVYIEKKDDGTTYVQPYDIDRYKFTEEMSNITDPVYLVVENEDDLQSAFEKATELNFDYVVYKTKLYSKETNFTVEEIYKGATQ